MNKDQLIGNWDQLAGMVREQWGRLTHDQVAEVKGRRQQLVGQIQEAYGVAKEEAQAQVERWEEACRNRSAA